VHAAALNLAFARHKIVTSEQKKGALIFTFDTELRNSVAAGISPLTLDNPQVTFEFLSEYFKQRYDSRLTECQAEREFENCLLGDIPFDEWLEKLNSLVLKCGWGPMTDRALRKQIIKGCDNAAARAELARLAPETATEAVRIYR